MFKDIVLINPPSTHQFADPVYEYVNLIKRLSHRRPGSRIADTAPVLDMQLLAAKVCLRWLGNSGWVMMFAEKLLAPFAETERII